MTPRTLEGQVLGKYRILEPLGRGGMAQVYRAYHPQLERYVAVKVLRTDLVEQEEFLARFQREARAVGGLRHPNVVQVFDFDVQDDLYYMVMELLEGDTLKARLNAYRAHGQVIPLGEMVRIMQDVLRGLGYAHQAGIIHRDVKPANILLTRQGEAVVTDFGIAQIVGGTNYTMSGALMGTLHYMAPEQGMGQKVDERSDLYSLGVVLYEMLAGHPPFDADTPLAILLKHLNDPLPLPRAPEMTIPQPFERVVLKALEKQPDDRYQSAQAMADAITRAVQQCIDPGMEAIVPPPASVQGADEASPSERLTVPPVYSGEARHALADAHFTEDETDMDLQKSLHAEAQPADPQPVLGQSVAAQGNTSEELSQAFQSLASALGGVATMAMSSVAESVRRAADTKAAEAKVAEAKQSPAQNRMQRAAPSQPVKPSWTLPQQADLKDAPVWVNRKAEAARDAEVLPPQLARISPRRGKPGQAAMAGVSLLLGFNLLAVWVGMAFNNWGTFAYGWPMELLLVGILLTLLMASLENLGMLIPVGIIGGNGLLMSFYAITNQWQLWSVFWPLEPLLILVSIFGTLFLVRNAPQPRQLARLLGTLLLLVFGAMVVIVGFGSLIIGAFHAVFG